MALTTAQGITIGGINCWEMERRERVGRSAQEGTRKIMCAWADRLTLAVYLAGGTTVVGGITQYSRPQPYPDAHQWSVWDIQIEGTDGDTGRTVDANGALAYKYAVLTTIYKPLEFNGDSIETGAEELDFGTDAQTTGQADQIFKWSDNSAPVKVLAQPVKKFTIIHFTKVIRSVPTLPITAISALLDCVNNATFMGAATGKMLFRGPRSCRRFTTGGVANWDITYSFSLRSQDWRKVYRGPNETGGAGWTTVLYSNGDPIYGAGDFTTLGIPANAQ